VLFSAAAGEKKEARTGLRSAFRRHCLDSPLKKRLAAALCERRRDYFCGNPAVKDRR